MKFKEGDKVEVKRFNNWIGIGEEGVIIDVEKDPSKLNYKVQFSHTYYWLSKKHLKKQKALKSFGSYKNKDTTWGTYCEPQCRCVPISIKKTGDESMKFKEGDRVINKTNHKGTIIRSGKILSEVNFDNTCYSISVENKVLKLLGESMTLNVNIKTNESKEVDYQHLVCEKLYKLGSFPFVKKDQRIGLGGRCGHENNHMFFISGVIQKILNDVAIFGGNKDFLLYLKLYKGVTWQDVYNKIKDIDSIEYNLDNV